MSETVNFTDLSFNVRYINGSWRASCRELPRTLDLQATAPTPELAVAGLAVNVQGMLTVLDEPVKKAIRERAQLTQEDLSQLERIGRHTFHRVHHLPYDYLPVKKTVPGALARVWLGDPIVGAGDDAGGPVEHAPDQTITLPPVLTGRHDSDDPYLRDSAYFIDGFKRGVQTAFGL
jgi:hypothetical protein